MYQSGSRDHRGPLSKNGPRYLRWALLEAATHAARHPCYADQYQATKQRLGRQRGSKVARVEVARKLAEAIWHMLTTQAPFRPARPHAHPLAARRPSNEMGQPDAPIRPDPPGEEAIER